MNVVVLGPGLMGTQIGCEYALGGHTVAMVIRRRPEAAADRLDADVASDPGREAGDRSAIAARRWGDCR